MFKKGERVLLVECGSFNPVTNMHLRMLEVARDAVEEHGAVVVGGLISPVSDGYGKAGLLSANHRVAMLREATASSDWIRVSEWESSVPQWTRTVAVLEHHQEKANILYGDDVRVALVVGGDVVETFKRILENGEPLWAPEDILDIVAKFGLVVLKRNGSDPEGILKTLECIDGYADRVVVSIFFYKTYFICY